MGQRCFDKKLHLLQALTKRQTLKLADVRACPWLLALCRSSEESNHETRRIGGGSMENLNSTRIFPNTSLQTQAHYDLVDYVAYVMKTTHLWF